VCLRISILLPLIKDDLENENSRVKSLLQLTFRINNKAEMSILLAISIIAKLIFTSSLYL
jgi:hypothetical protein